MGDCWLKVDHAQSRRETNGKYFSFNTKIQGFYDFFNAFVKVIFENNNRF